MFGGMEMKSHSKFGTSALMKTPTRRDYSWWRSFNMMVCALFQGNNVLTFGIYKFFA
jgi:hypothetical protein